MSVTTISNSLGLRAGDGRVATSFSTNRSSAASSSTNITSSSSSVPAMPANTAVTNSSKNINIDGKNNNVSPKDTQSKTHLGSVPTITVSSSDPPLPKAYGKIVLTLENVLIPEDKISPTPSSLDGLDPECEIDFRIMGCELIVSSGTLLRLPQTAMATGQVLFQRFYYSKSFVRQPMETTAIACVYLASKIEEAPRRIRDVINVFHHIKQVRSGKLIQPLILDQSYVRLKSDVTLAERRVLKELGFCVHVKHPHKLIVIYMQQLGYDKDSRFVQMSWNYMNDALRSNVFVRYTPEAIACACIFLSGRMLKILLPTNPAWYMVFDVSESQIIDICENILMLYERPKVQYEQLEKKVDVLVKNYQDSRQKTKSSTSSLMDKPSSGTPNTSSPGSRPNSPSAGPQSATTVSLTKPKESSDNEKRRRHEDNYQDGRRSAASSPAPKKSRRSPSPIEFPSPRHKHKKRKKSRHSHSESSSPSRSRERRSLKKHARRERSRSFSPRRHHHKKSKSHHRDRYKSRSRSFSPPDRDRERGRSPQETLGKYDQKDYDKYYYKMKSAKSSSKHNRDREDDLGRGKGGRDKDRR